MTHTLPLVQDPASLDERFAKRLQQAEAEVAREFGDLDRELVHREFVRVTDDLLRSARVTDFVPVLVHRQVRENLKNQVAAAYTAAT